MDLCIANLVAFALVDFNQIQLLNSRWAHIFELGYWGPKELRHKFRLTTSKIRLQIYFMIMKN